MYYLEDGRSYSSLVPVYLQVGYGVSDGQVMAPGRTNIFPNPGDGRFCITLSEPFDEASLRVVDILGREILHVALDEATSWVEIHNRLPGIYLLNLSIDQKQEQYRILLK